MKISFKETIAELQRIEEEFNKSDNPTTRYALIMCIKHIAKNLPIAEHFEEEYRKGMLIDHGIDERELRSKHAP